MFPSPRVPPIRDAMSSVRVAVSPRSCLPAESAFMPSSYLQGIQNSFDNQSQIVNDIYVVTSNWFVNRCPIVTRTPRVALTRPR